MGRARLFTLIATTAGIAVLATSCILSGTWTEVTPIDPVAGSNDAELVDVSCPTEDFCMAVGNTDVVTHTRPTTPFVEVWNGDTWSTIEFLNFAPHPEYDGSELVSVSCGTPTSCAVGIQNFGPGESNDQYYIWTGSSWLQVPSTSWKAGFAAGDCAPDGSCRFVLWDYDVVTWDGTEFTLDPSYPPPLPQQMACTSVTSCLGINASFVYVWDSVGVTTAAGPDVPGSTRWTGFECAAADDCLVVGTTGTGPSAVARSFHFDGTTWTEVALPVTAPSEIRSLSCASSYECLAIASTTDGSPATTRDVVLGWNGGRWFVAPSPDLGAASIAAVACAPDSTRCLAVGADPSGPTTEPAAWTYTWPSS